MYIYIYTYIERERCIHTIASVAKFGSRDAGRPQAACSRRQRAGGKRRDPNPNNIISVMMMIIIIIHYY